MLEIKPSEQKVKKISPKNLVSKIVCEPNLEKEIYTLQFQKKITILKIHKNCLMLCNLVDGTNSYVEISKLMKTSRKKTSKLINILLKNNLIEYIK